MRSARSRSTSWCVDVGRAQTATSFSVAPLDPDAEVRAASASIASTSRMRGTLRSTTSLVGEQARGEQRQGGVLVAGGDDRARQRHAAFDDELLHESGARAARRRSRGRGAGLG